MIRLRARPDYHHRVLKINYEGESEVLKYEYEQDNGNNSEDALKSGSADEDEQEVEESIVELLSILNEPEKQ